MLNVSAADSFALLAGYQLYGDLKQSCILMLVLKPHGFKQKKLLSAEIGTQS